MGLWIGTWVAAPATFSCASARSVPPDRSVVLPTEQLEEVLGQCSRSGPTARDVQGTWEVPEEVVARLEADLPRMRRMRARECCLLGRMRDPGLYYRQYVGIVLDGRRMVYINAFQTAEGAPDWHERANNRCDGGSDYWGAVYDPETRRFSRLGFNGEA